jgi:predicted site-specific integrase-resolvase
MAARRAAKKAKSKRVFGQRQEPAKMFRVGLYARVSTHDQQTLPLQMRAMRAYAAKRGWAIAVQIKSKKSVRARQSVNSARICLQRRDAVRSMSCSSGGWIAGAGHSSIWSLR